MNSETKLVVEIWENIRDVIPANKRADAIYHILQCLDEYGVEFKSADILGEDPYIDEAYKTLYDIEDEEDDAEIEYDDE